MTKLVKEMKVVQLFDAKSRNTAGTLYNDASDASGIDCRDYDEAVLLVNAGTFSTDASVTISLYEKASGDVVASGAAVSGGTFAAITSASDNLAYTGSVDLRGRKRYLWAKVVTTGTGAALYGVQLLLHKGDNSPYANSGANEKVFDV